MNQDDLDLLLQQSSPEPPHPLPRGFAASVLSRANLRRAARILALTAAATALVAVLLSSLIGYRVAQQTAHQGPPPLGLFQAGIVLDPLAAP